MMGPRSSKNLGGGQAYFYLIKSPNIGGARAPPDPLGDYSPVRVVFHLGD